MKGEGLKVTIAVQRKFQAFRLMEELSKRGLLNEFFTVYPKFKIPPYRIPLDRVRSVKFLGALIYLNGRFKIPISETFISFVFDGLVSSRLKKPSGQWIFHGWNGYCEKSLEKAKKLGGVTVVDRPCPHIDFQRKLEAEERSRLLGQKIVLKQNPVHEKMAREYGVADYIFVPSRYSRQTFLDLGLNEDKVKLLPLCNEKMTSPPTEPRSYKKLSVLCVGGNFYRKGIYYLLRAWQELGLKDAELVIKGEVPKEFRSLTVGRDLKIITSHLSDEEMNKLYQSANLFVLPSVDDGFGMVVVEAMRTGLPVIVSSNVGAADSVENGKDGFIFPFRDIEALKEKIRYFHGNSEKLKTMGEAAILKSKNYTPEAYTDRVVRVYNQIVE